MEASAAPTRRKAPSPRATRGSRLTDILDAAVKLFERQGYYGTTMQQIAAKAGMSVGLIYNFASNKEEVLLLVISDILEGYAREIPIAMAQYTHPVERLTVGFAAYCRIVDQRRDAVVLAYRETKTLSRKGRERLKMLESTTTDLLTSEIKTAIDGGYFVPTHADLVAHNLMIVAHAWALKHWHLAPEYSLQEYVSFQISFLLDSLCVPGVSVAYPALVSASLDGRRSGRAAE